MRVKGFIVKRLIVKKSMVKRFIARFLFLIGVSVGGLAQGDDHAPMDLENTLYMDVNGGRVVIKMRPDLAPKHVAQIKELTRQGFYNGLTFHRVIPGFVAQGGDPDGNGTGGSGRTIPAEFSDTKHQRGTVSMARAADPDSADSQFFICYADLPSLDGQYTVWGEVVKGMYLVDRIRPGTGANGMVLDQPTVIERMQVAADVEDEQS